MKKYSLFVFIVMLIIASCSSENAKKNNPIKQIVNVPNFNEDSAYFFVEKQVNFGPRYISSKGWKKCGDYLIQTLKRYTANVNEQSTTYYTYDRKKHELRNIIAEFNPEKNNRILLCAHWDTRHVADHDSIDVNNPILGANDGGSGTAVLLEIARQLSIQDCNIGVDIILFDAEDYGQPENSPYPRQEHTWCIGSQYWSKNPHKKDYHARYGILLDMVAGHDAIFKYESVSKFYAERTLNKVWKAASILGYGRFFQYQITPEIIDDHYYINTLAKIPTIDIIEHDNKTKTGFNKYWHTHGDNMQNISKKTLKAVGQTVLHVIYNE